MATVARRYTIDDLESLTAADRWFEIIDGELHEMAPSGFEHSSIGLRLGGMLTAFVITHRLGATTGADGGYVFSREPFVMFAPDVAFVREDRLPPREQRQQILEVVPDLVVEVVSPNDSAGEVHAKVLRYLEFGVRLVWLVHPQQRSIAVYTPDGHARVLRERDALDGADVVPGFSLPLADVFA